MRGACITGVINGSPAHRVGVRAGDLLFSINGEEINDIIDYLYHSSESRLRLEMERDGEPMRAVIKKGAEEILGLRFEGELFDGIRICRNSCHFCFVDQVPAGMRDTLKIKDDDYRLSFLSGNFISLTNLTGEDWRKIDRYRLSPLYISVHATNPELRARIFRHRDATLIEEQLRKLAESNITVHTQIVLCPGINDGEELERSVRELSLHYPSVASIAIVPVGVTRYLPDGSPIRAVTRDEMKAVIRRISAWQREFRKRLGTPYVYGSDEFYLKTGTPLPRHGDYSDYPQIENGVGLMRKFVTEYMRSRRFLPRSVPSPRKVSVVTSALASPVISSIIDDFNRIGNVEVKLHTVRNSFWGESHVDVGGLLTGRDILMALKREKAHRQVLIPSVCLRDDALFLDDLTLDDISSGTGGEAIPVPVSFRELRNAILCGEDGRAQA
jgi:putative radical SAM enzyme (TIGR03279 family)